MDGGFDVSELVGGQPQQSASAVPPAATATIESTPVVEIPKRAARRMFYEQIASQHSILQLIENRFERFDYGEVERKGDLASIRVTARYRDKEDVHGGESDVVMHGTLVLRRYDGMWFFETLADDEHLPNKLWTSPKYDEDFVNNLMSVQAKRQDAIQEILDGTHTRFTIDRVQRGSGTVTVVGKQVGDEVGTEFVIVKKIIDGRVYWFIAGVQQR